MRLDILEEHADEATFLYEHRRRALRSLALDRDFLRGIDERLLAHLDGLVVAGDAGWEIAAALFDAGEPAGALVAAGVALLAAEAPQLDALERALLAAPPPAFAALLAAVRLWFHGVTTASDRAPRWLDRPEPRLRAAALGALAAAGRPQQAALARALADAAADPVLLCAALAGAARTRDRQLLAPALELAAHADAAVRASALEAALLIAGPQPARDLARRLFASDEDRGVAARVLGLAGEAPDASALAGALSGAPPEHERSILLALGNLGCLEAVDPLLEAARGDGRRARVAGFALCRVLGPAGDWRPRPPPPASADQGDEDAEGPWTPDDELPLWLVDPIAGAWQRVRPGLGAGGRLRHGVTLVAGTPSPRPPLGIQHDEAIEAALAAPGTPLPDVEALSVPDLFAWRAAPAVPAPAPAASRSRHA